MVSASALLTSYLLIAAASAQALYGYPDPDTTRTSTTLITPTSSSITRSTSSPTVSSVSKSSAVSSGYSSSVSRSSSRLSSTSASASISASASTRSRTRTRSKPSSSVTKSGSAASTGRPASSGSISRSVSGASTGRSSSVRGTASSSSSQAACPAFTPEPNTITLAADNDVFLSTTTVTVSEVKTERLTRSTVASVVDFGGSTTITITSTFTLTAVEILPAATTVTVPTPAGFTPVKCLPAYHRSTATEYFTRTYDVTTSYLVVPGTSTTTFVTDVYTSISTSTIILADTTTKYLFSTVTSTSTRADPTRTVYEACATNNVVSERLYGGFFNYLTSATARNGTDGPIYPLTNSLQVPAADAVDCCALCQANSTCTSNYYVLEFNQPPYPRVPAYCIHYFKNPVLDQTCDPRFVGSVTGPPIPSGGGIFISNGACGQSDILPYYP